MFDLEQWDNTKTRLTPSARASEFGQEAGEGVYPPDSRPLYDLLKWSNRV
jgi:hypothetical protein